MFLGPRKQFDLGGELEHRDPVIVCIARDGYGYSMFPIGMNKLVFSWFYRDIDTHHCICLRCTT